jgi:hypothetical protein
MSKRTDDYIGTQLASNGFVIQDTKLAYEINPNHWTSRIDACTSVEQYADLFERIKGYPNIKQASILINGRTVPVYTRSLLDLEKRIECLTGFEAVLV